VRLAGLHRGCHVRLGDQGTPCASAVVLTLPVGTSTVVITS
jgi:hypothetical protein